jgi:hypothetical protein
MTSWSGWSPLPTVQGGFFTGPSVTSWATGSEVRLDVFAPAYNGSIGHIWYSQTSASDPSVDVWSDWDFISAPESSISSVVAAVSPGPDLIDLFVVSDGALLQNSYNGGGSGWSGWGSSVSGSSLSGGPAACSWHQGRIDVFAPVGDGIAQATYTGGEWTSFNPLPVLEVGMVQAEGGGYPAAVCWEPGRIDLFAIGNDGALWHLWFSNGAWSSNWASLGTIPVTIAIQATAINPAAASWGPGRLDVFALGDPDVLQHTWYDNNSGFDDNWDSPIPGPTGDTFTQPTAVSCNPGRIDVFVGEGPPSSLQVWWNSYVPPAPVPLQ